MRFNAIIISALAAASLGVKAAPTADGDLQARNPTPPACVEYCIFPGWDCNTGDLHDGVSQAHDVDGCASSGFSRSDCDTTVHNGNFCYGKTRQNALSWNFYANQGRDLAIKGKCRDLEDSCRRETDIRKRKLNLDMFQHARDSPSCYHHQ